MRLLLALGVFVFALAIASCTAQAATINCTNCSDCMVSIESASSGDVIQLNASVSNQTGTCISFGGKDNLTFDCLGNTIDGNGTADSYGIWLNGTANGSNNNTIMNCTVTDFYYGLYLDSSSGNTIIFSSCFSNTYGITLAAGSGNNTLENVNASGNSWAGISIWSSDQNNITNSTAYGNAAYGFHINKSSGNIIAHSHAKDTGYYDLYVEADSDSHCGNSITNITGSGDRAIAYYNYSANVSNQVLSQLVLCDADGSSISNVTVSGSISNNGLLAIRTDSSSFTGINSSYSMKGIVLQGSSNNTLSSLNLNDNLDYGIDIRDSNPGNNTVTGITANSNGYDAIFIRNSTGNRILDAVALYSYNAGLELYSASNNTLTNLSISSSAYGIYLDYGSQGNTINGSYVLNSSVSGVYIANSGQELSSSNLLYNNLFNNSVNMASENSSNLNYWNTTNSTGPNIVGGPYIGGNRWASPYGNGTLENCTDSNYDGYCDSEYSLDSNNTDYLPLAGNQLLIGFALPASNNSITNKNWIFVNVTAGEILPWCVLDWYNGTWTNVSMASGGKYCYANMTGLENGSYYFRAYANDTFGMVNATGDMQVSVDIVFPVVSITSPINGTNYSSVNITLNFTYLEANPHTCWYDYNGTNATLENCTGTNFTALDHNQSQLWVWMNDTAGNLNCSQVVFSVCTESWSCSDWSVCSGGVQSRACTDSYSCGTFINRPALSQSCSTGGGGGGGTAVIEPLRVQKTWENIEPGEAVSFSINKSGLEFSEIKVAVNTQVNNISVTVTKLELKPAEAPQVSGKVYQYVSVNATNLNQSSLNSTGIRFRVSKSWISQNNIDRGRVYLNRYAGSSWVRLNTTYDGEDSLNFYYMAESPGFSYFAITGEIRIPGSPVQNQTQAGCNNNTVCEAGENQTSCPLDCRPQKQCEAGMFMCHGSILDGCQDGIWVTYMECKNGCLNARCLEAPAELPRIDAVIIIIASGAVAIAVELFLWRKKFSPWRYFRV